MQLPTKISFNTLAQSTIFIVLLSQVIFNGGNSLIYSNLISLLSIIPFSLYLFYYKKTVYSDINTSFYLLMSIYFIVSIIWRPLSFDFLRLKTYTMVPVFLLILYNLIKWSDGLKQVVYAFAFGVVINFILYVINVDSAFFGDIYIGRRFVGTLQQFNMAALFYVSTIMIITFNFDLAKIKTKIIYFIIIILASILTIATGSKKGIIILLISWILFYFMLDKSIKQKIFKVSLYISPLLFILIPFILKEINFDDIYELSIRRFDRLINSISNMLSGQANIDTSFNERTYLLKTAFMKFWNSPLFGHGVDSFYFYNDLGLYSHNNYLELLFNGGIIAFGLYYIRYFVLFQMILRLKRRIAVPFIILFLMFLFIEMVDVTVYKKLFQYLFLVTWLMVEESYNKLELNLHKL